MMASVYSVADGLFTGLQLSGDAQFVADNVPAGCAAWPGSCDAGRVRVDLVTQTLVPYQPPAPADDLLRSWAWDAEMWRWQAIPTEAALAAAVRAERERRLVACDWVALRAFETGQAIPAAWLAYRQALRDVTLQEGFPRQVQWPVPPGP